MLEDTSETPCTFSPIQEDGLSPNSYFIGGDAPWAVIPDCGS